MWQGALDVATGSPSGGTIAAFVMTGGLVAGAVRRARPRSMETCCAARAQRRGWASCSRNSRRSGRRPAPRPSAVGARPAGVRGCDLPLSDPPGQSRAQRISLACRSGPARGWRVVGPSGAGKSDPVPACPAFLRPRDRPRDCWMACRCLDADPADVARAHRHGAAGEDDLRRPPLATTSATAGWDASEEEIWAAAEAANAADSLRALPEGLDTYLGEGGARLRAAQRQRCGHRPRGAARCAAAAARRGDLRLDAESERLVQGALERLMEGRTTHRHRPSPCNGARGGPDHRDGPGPHRGGRPARCAGRASRALCPPRPPPVRRSISHRSNEPGIEPAIHVLASRGLDQAFMPTGVIVATARYPSSSRFRCPLDYSRSGPGRRSPGQRVRR